MYFQPQQTTRAINIRRDIARARYARLFPALLMAALLISVSMQGKVEAQEFPSDLDPTFGINGKVTTDFFGGEDRAAAVAIQPDGKIVVVGQAKTGTSANDFIDFALARYNRDGSLDTSFGNGGKATTDFLGFNDYVTKIFIQPNGKLVLAGFATDSSAKLHLALARYNRNGSLDDGTSSDSTPADSFGNGGKVVSDFLDGTRAIAFQPDGKLLVVGQVGVEFTLARYNKDGSLDTPFGDGGRVLTDVYGTGSSVSAVAVQADGKIVVGGTAYDHIWPPGERENFALVRYNKDGSLDDGTSSDSTPSDSFGDGGKVVVDVGQDSDYLNDIAIQPDGRILASGYAYSYCCPGIYAVIVRFNTDGTMDDGMGGDSTPADSFGRIFAGHGTVSIFGDMIVQPGGLIAVTSYADYSYRGSFIVDIFNSSSGLDSSAFVPEFGDGTAAALASQPDGKVVVIGNSIQNGVQNSSDFAIARLNGDPVATSIDSLALAPSNAPGSPANLTGTIKINAPAPPEGLIVTLESTNGAASVPARIRIPAGKSTQDFTIKTTPMLTLQSGNLIARMGKSIKSTPLVVQPLGVASLTLNPSTVDGSKPVTGVVTLNAPAPEGGMLVQLSSRNPGVVSPVASSITIPAGARVKSFTLRVAGTASGRTAVVTATANGVSKSAVLTVQ
ncbi:MAG TPA: hypothetical protein VF708_08115 [Pyrinomonadaceae bacterium]|jgi:uncharacterized delta-60 repeat protein